MSFKSLPGVLEDMKVPEVRNGLRELGQPLVSILEIFIKITHLEPCQDSRSFKSFPGVLEDIEVPDKDGNYVRGLGQPL